MKIGEVAKASGASVRSIRHYEAVGLIRSTRAGNGYRDFEADTAPLVRRIRRLIGLGFSTGELIAMLPGLVGEAFVVTDCIAVTEAHKKKLDQIERKIADLESLRKELLMVLRTAAEQASCLPQNARWQNG